MTFLRVDSSIRRFGSVSRELLDAVERGLLATSPDMRVVRRDLAAAPPLSSTWQLAATGLMTPEEQWAPATHDAKAVATRVADELLGADVIAVGAPLYNFGVPAVLKSWIDLLITDPRFRPPASPLVGRPLTLAVARGGGYGPGSPREGWDHATPYLMRIFGDVFGADVTLVAAELTAADADPEMADLRPMAARSRTAAIALAEATGADHAGRRGGTATALSA